MIEKLTKGISALIPFLAAYPPWVKVLFSAWVLLSAALLLALLLARGTMANTATDNDSSAAAPESVSKPLWFSIDGVDLFGGLEGGKVKVVANINGLEYRYPSLEGVEWMEVSPTMSSQQFRLPRAEDGYSVRFTMTLKKNGEVVRLVSQRTDHFDTPPFNGRYSVYRVGEENTRSASVEAQIEYTARE